MSAPDRQGHDRADVLALDVERPALGHLARPEGRGQGVGGRVAAAQPAQVDDVPRPPLGRAGEVAGQRLGDGRQVGGRRQDRGVVGVVRGTEEDRGRRRRDRRQVRRRAPWRIFVWASASSGSTSWRCISGTIATGSAPGRRVGRDEDERLLVGVRAVGVPPRTLEGPAGERRRPRAALPRARPRSAAGCRRSSGARRASGDGAGAAVSAAVGLRTGRLRVKGQGSHA